MATATELWQSLAVYNPDTVWFQDKEGLYRFLLPQQEGLVDLTFDVSLTPGELELFDVETLIGIIVERCMQAEREEERGSRPGEQGG